MLKRLRARRKARLEGIHTSSARLWYVLAGRGVTLRHATPDHVEVVVLKDDIELGFVADLGRVVVDEAAVSISAIERAAAAVGSPRQRVDAVPRPA